MIATNKSKSRNIEIKVSEASPYIKEYFYEDNELVELFTNIQNEMTECDPDLLFCKRGALIGMAKPDEKFRVYISPAEETFDIKFLHIEEKIPFRVENRAMLLKQCEPCVMHALKKPKLVSNSVESDTVDEDLVDLDDSLNRSQRKFCKLSITKNIRLLAPAGSGKTYSILWRCKYITEECKRKEKEPPYFLLITFTKAACLELEERLKKDSRFRNIRATVRTLNAWGWEQNKKAGKELALNKFERRNLITHDLQSICKKYDFLERSLKSNKTKTLNAEIIIELIDLYKSLGFKHTMLKPEYKAHIRELKELGLYSIINSAHEKLYELADVKEAEKKEKEKILSEFFNFWKKAVVRLEENNRYTFEDQKYWAEEVLKQKMKLGKYPQGITRYTHVFVDEFQDTNPLDISLIKTICKYHGKGKFASLTIVGDDDQAIFGWRGTTPKYILYPEKFFGVKFETAILNTNYRSPKNIVELSRKLIENNLEREPKDMKSMAKGRAYVKIISRQKMTSSIDVTMRLIHELIEDKDCNQVALIGRRQASIFPYQVLLSAEGKEYNVDADLDIFDGEAMTSLQEIIKIIYRAKDYDNDDPCGDLLKVCDKVYRYGLKRNEKLNIADYLDKNGATSFHEAVEILSTYPNAICGHPAQRLADAVRRLCEAKSVYEFMVNVEEYLQGLGKDYSKADQDNHYKEPQFFRLTEVARKYGTDYRKFHKDIEKARRNSEFSRTRNNSDTISDYADKQAIKIHLMTATRSKGHEFDGVIILDTYDSEWPHHLSNDIEEERRLFYVAMTRAKRYLYFITSADQEISRFIEEIGLNN